MWLGKRCGDYGHEPLLIGICAAIYLVDFLICGASQSVAKWWRNQHFLPRWGNVLSSKIDEIIPQLKRVFYVTCLWSLPILCDTFLAKIDTKRPILRSHSCTAFSVDFFVSEKMFMIYMVSRLWTFFKKRKRLTLIPLRLCKGSGFFKSETQRLFYIYLKSARLRKAKDGIARNSLIAYRFCCGAQSPLALVQRRACSFLRGPWFEAVGGSLTKMARFFIAFLNLIFS